MSNINQSFFLRTKLLDISARDCSNYSPDCASGGCSSRTCHKTGNVRITTYQRTGSNATPRRGGGTHKEFLNRIKKQNPQVMRGEKSTHATLIRSMRPVQQFGSSTVGKRNNDNTAIVLNRVHHVPNKWNTGRQKECCTDTLVQPQKDDNKTTINQLRGYPQKGLPGPGNICK
jgi:hypothetical protein